MPFFSTARPMDRMTTGSSGARPSRGGRGAVGAANRARSRPWRTRVTFRASAASDVRWAAPTAVQVTSQSQAASFSRFSQSGVVQMSLAWAETLQGLPVISAA